MASIFTCYLGGFERDLSSSNRNVIGILLFIDEYIGYFLVSSLYLRLYLRLQSCEMVVKRNPTVNKK